MNIQDYIKHRVTFKEGDAFRILSSFGDVEELKDEDSFNELVALYVDNGDDDIPTYIWDVETEMFQNMSVDSYIDMKMNPSLEESTTSASSGAYQTPFSISESKFNSLVKKALLLEYVYGSDAAKATEKNTKTPKREKAKTHNVNAPYEDKSNAGKLSNDDMNVEAHANGMQDVEYDSLPEESAKKMKAQFTAGDTKEKPTGEKLLDGAKNRKKSKEESVPNTISLGSDIEASDAKPKTKDSIAESKVYRITKNLPLNEANLYDILTRNQKKLRGTSFIVEDTSGSRVKVDWAGEIAKISILENLREIKKSINTTSKLFEAFKPKETVQSNPLNENEILKKSLSNRKK